MTLSRVMFFRGPRAASRAAAFIAVFLVGVVAALAAGIVWHLRAVALDSERARAEDHALSLAEHAQQVFSAGSFVLEGVVQNIQGKAIPSSAALRRQLATSGEHALLRAREESFLALLLVAIVDAEGRVVSNSRDFPAPDIQVADRDSFTQARDGQAGTTYISAPVRSRTDNRWTIFLSRRLESPAGEFIGVAFVGLSCEYFARFYEALRMDRREPLPEVTAMTLLRDDLTVMARAPFDEHGLGRPLREDGAYGPYAGEPAPAGEPRFGPWDADPALRDRLVLAVRPVDGFPLQVAVAARDTLYLNLWSRQALAIGGFALLASLPLVCALSVLVRVLRRSEHLLEESQRLRSAAEAANRAKSDFLATMSHEIRTPMNGILGTADLLVRSGLPRRERELAETLLRSGRSLLGIINDILDLSRIEAGELKVQRAAFSPAGLLREVHDLFAGYAAAKGLELVVERAGDVPEAVLGDADRVRQVLGNLVSNAIKFSESGRVRLGLERIGRPGGEPVLRFEVEDNGVGIPPEARPHLFQPFAQADSSIARRFGGTGLGLAISKRLVELMGGRIDFDSRTGRGTRFWFELPATPADVQALAVAGEPHERPEFRFAHSGAMPMTQAEPVSQAKARPHVLLVEDNAVNAMVAEAQLERLGCSCDIAVDGHDALICLRGSRYDLVLMDCMLPRVSGYEVTRQWREEESARGLQRLPVIALTANALASNVEESRLAGMDDFLTKPCTLDKLAAVLRRWLAPGEGEERRSGEAG